MAALTTAIHILSHKIAAPLPNDLEQSENPWTKASAQRTEVTDFSLFLFELVFLIFLLAASVLDPSLLSFLYFIYFLASATWLACDQSFQRIFFIGQFVLTPFLGFHSVLIYIYQFLHSLLPPNSFLSRLLGLKVFVYDSPCYDVRSLRFVKHNISDYASPLAIISLYLHSLMLIRYKLLVMNDTTLRGKSVKQVENFPAESPANIPLCHRKIFLNLLRLIGQNGIYIATLITMMAWSISYHSLLSFIFLLSFCIVWMTPNSRKNFLFTAIFLVAYAQILLLRHYVYSLNLTEEELPTSIAAVNLQDVGLTRYYDNNLLHILIKISFTVVYWLALWIYIEQRKETKQKLLAPPPDSPQKIQTDAEVSNGGFQQELKPLGRLLTAFLPKVWIWVVACMLLLLSLGSEAVALYQIIYLVFFLVFFLLFLISYETWRRGMKLFCVLVIIYSMFILVLCYLYQFTGAPGYLETHLGIGIELQNDFGLIFYENREMLLPKLLIPIFFLIITITQLHSFHDKFLVIYDLNRPLKKYVTEDSRAEEVDLQTLQEQPAKPATDFSKISNKNDFLQNVLEILWKYLEIHINRIAIFAMILLALSEVNVFHIIYLLMGLVALPLPSLQLFLCHCGALLTCLLLLLQMIFQLQFMAKLPLMSRIDCTIQTMTNSSISKEIDKLKWIGLGQHNFRPYCLGYSGLIATFIFRAFVLLRQKFRTILPKGEQDGIIFPNVTRWDADRSLKLCAQYLLNYIFYKFGVEICFMTAIISVGFRMDFLGLLSLLWIIGLFHLKRSTISRLWPLYVLYQEIVLVLQYLALVGLPPGLCYEYPWGRWSCQTLRGWLFLPSYDNPPLSLLLVGDVILLTFSCCQDRVFHVESRAESEKYPGGSNNDINYSEPFSNNPVNDFITNTKSYLDVFKVAVFYSFYWVTLSVLFIAGARSGRLSVLAMGYIFSCFYFLWLGNEFYLKPRRKLFRG